MQAPLLPQGRRHTGHWASKRAAVAWTHSWVSHRALGASHTHKGPWLPRRPLPRCIGVKNKSFVRKTLSALCITRRGGFNPLARGRRLCAYVGGAMGETGGWKLGSGAPPRPRPLRLYLTVGLTHAVSFEYYPPQKQEGTPCSGSYPPSFGFILASKAMFHAVCCTWLRRPHAGGRAAGRSGSGGRAARCCRLLPSLCFLCWRIQPHALHAGQLGSSCRLQPHTQFLRGAHPFAAARGSPCCRQALAGVCGAHMAWFMHGPPPRLKDAPKTKCTHAWLWTCACSHCLMQGQLQSSCLLGPLVPPPHVAWAGSWCAGVWLGRVVSRGLCGGMQALTAAGMRGVRAVTLGHPGCSLAVTLVRRVASQSG